MNATEYTEDKRHEIGNLDTGMQKSLLVLLCFLLAVVGTAPSMAQEADEEPPAGGIGVPAAGDIIEPTADGLGIRVDISPGEIEVMQFLRFLSDNTGLPVIIDSTARGQFQQAISITAPIKFADANIVRAILEANKFLVVREIVNGREFLRVDSSQGTAQPSAEPKETRIIQVSQTGIVQEVSSETVGEKIDLKPDQLATMVFTLKYTEPSDAIQALNNLISGSTAKASARSRAFSLVEVQNSMMVIITAKFGLLNYLRTLLNLIDVPVQEPERIVQIIEVEHADVDDLVQVIEQFLQGRGAGGRFGGARRTTQRATPRRRTGQQGAATPAASAAATADGQSTNLIADFRTNKLIIETYSESDLEDINMLVRELDVRFDLRRLRTHIYQVRYLKADEIANDLSIIVGGSGGASGSRGLGRRTGRQTRGRGVPRRGATTTRAGGVPQAAGGGGAQSQQVPALIVPHIQTNSLLIQAEPEEWSEIIHILKQIDVKRRQVFLEAALVQVNSSSDLNYTIELLAGDPDNEGTRALFESSFGLTGIDLANFNRVIPNIADPASVPAGGLLAVMDRGKFPALVSFLKTNQDSEVLATPFILADDNFQNVIEILETRFVQNTNTVNVSTTTSQEAEDAGITLDITPTITEDAVFLELELAVSQFQDGGTPQLLPPKNDNSIISAVTVPDGQIFVIGGLTRENRSKTVSKVPLLGDIPLIGKLFRSERTTRSAANLYIFLRAHVLTHSQFADGIELTDQASQQMNDFSPGIKVSTFDTPNVPPEAQAPFDPDAARSFSLRSGAPAGSDTTIRTADPGRGHRETYENDVENPYNDNATLVRPVPRTMLPGPEAGSDPEFNVAPGDAPSGGLSRPPGGIKPDEGTGSAEPSPETSPRTPRSLEQQGLEIDPTRESWLVPLRPKTQARATETSSADKRWLGMAPNVK